MRRRKYFFLFFIILHLLFGNSVFAQIKDDFTDGNFSNDPPWQGTVSSFIINPAKQLQLNAPSSGDAYLISGNKLISNTEWQFYIKLSFSPSSNNFARIYLVSDNADLTQALNGYFIQLGEAGSLDAIDLYRQDGISITKIAAGVAGRVAKNLNELRIKVIRDSIGNWSVYSDTTGGTNFVAEGKGADNRYNSTTYFGVYAKFTASNINKIIWDDISIKAISKDTLPPRLQTIQVISGNELLLTFNEPINNNTATNPANYTVDQGIGNPANVIQVSALSVSLHFNNSFTPRNRYKLQLSGIQDIGGNIINRQEQEFVYDLTESAAKFDVLINEIMADPEPPLALPNSEFIELYNHSNKSISLKNWTLSDPSSSGILPDFNIGPDSFVIICPAANINNFNKYGKTFSLSTWPSLNNDGDSLILRNDKGEIIHSVAYTDSWYKDDFKKNGGWSLEMIDVNNPCTGAENWKASLNPEGGTPGKPNSAETFNPDAFAPYLIKAVVENDSAVTLYFSESLDENSLLNPSNFSITPDVNSPLISQPNSPWNTRTALHLKTKLESGKKYSLKINDLKDCAGNSMVTKNLISLGLPQPADSFDVVINEILFNPLSGGEDFVELYNRSNKFINLKELLISTADAANPIKDAKTITGEGYLLAPGDYVVLTSNKKNLEDNYTVKNPDKIIEINALPGFGDKEGTLVLAKKNGQIIDRLTYNENWHYALLQNKEGVSLEKLNPNLSTQKQGHWHSAASSAGYATPTYQNSQFQEKDIDIKNKSVWIDPPVLSPDADGFQDILDINYKFGSPGYSASVDIFDIKGRIIKKLAINSSLATEGSFFWDGITDTNTKAPIGIYIVLVTVFHPQGETEIFKIPVTVAGKF